MLKEHLITTIKITTFSSTWILDSDSMFLVRLPNSENPTHPNLSYEDVGHPVSFVYAHSPTLNYYCIHLDEQSRVFPDKHRRITPGYPATLSGEWEDMGQLEDCP